MKIIPFNVEKAKSGKYKIQTRSGKSVRIICWDKKGSEYNIIALIKVTDKEERAYAFMESGIYLNGEKNDYDLVLVDESTPSIRQQIYNAITQTYQSYPEISDVIHISASLLADFIQEGLNLPKWKRIYKGERLPETSYIKSDFHSQSFMPCMRGVEMGSDCWYLPVIVLNELENEEQKN